MHAAANGSAWGVLMPITYERRSKDWRINVLTAENQW
jgi:hypothetical protein